MSRPIRRHVTHLLTAYVHQQLSARQRDRVHRHLDECPTCRAALAREQFIARDLKQYMPLVGRPERGQLRRLWPRIRTELWQVSPIVKLLPSFSVIAMMVLIFTISVSALFGGTGHAIAAPNVISNADVKATNTPVRTEEPIGGDPAAEVQASQTASPLAIPPQASPAPPPIRRASGLVSAP
jgi:anti-sigma factor RsiW